MGGAAARFSGINGSQNVLVNRSSNMRVVLRGGAGSSSLRSRSSLYAAAAATGEAQGLAASGGANEVE